MLKHIKSLFLIWEIGQSGFKVTTDDLNLKKDLDKLENFAEVITYLSSLANWTRTGVHPVTNMLVFEYVYLVDPVDILDMDELSRIIGNTPLVDDPTDKDLGAETWPKDFK